MRTLIILLLLIATSGWLEAVETLIRVDRPRKDSILLQIDEGRVTTVLQLGATVATLVEGELDADGVLRCVLQVEELDDRRRPVIRHLMLIMRETHPGSWTGTHVHAEAPVALSGLETLAEGAPVYGLTEPELRAEDGLVLVLRYAMPFVERRRDRVQKTQVLLAGHLQDGQWQWDAVVGTIGNLLAGHVCNNQSNVMLPVVGPSLPITGANIEAEVVASSLQVTNDTLSGTLSLRFINSAGNRRDFEDGQAHELSYRIEGRRLGAYLVGTYVIEGQEGSQAVIGQLGSADPEQLSPANPGGFSPVVAGPVDITGVVAAEDLQPLPVGELGVDGVPGIYTKADWAEGWEGENGHRSRRPGPVDRFWCDYYASFIHPPTFRFDPVDGAAGYRAVFHRVATGGAKEGQAVEELFADQVDALGADGRLDLTRWWARLETGMAFDVRLHAVDAAGTEIAVQERRFARRPAYQGNAFDASMLDSEQAMARLRAAVRWQEVSPFKVMFRLEGVLDDSSAGGKKDAPNPPDLGAGGLLMAALGHEVAEDEQARLCSALMGRQALRYLQARTGGAYNLPGGWYKTDASRVAFAGMGYLDYFLATGDAQAQALALEMNQSLAEVQKPSGAWTWFGPNGWYGSPPGGSGSYRNRSPEDWNVTEGGWLNPAWREFDMPEFLLMMGRVRSELGSEDCIEAERLGYRWTVERTARTMVWNTRWSMKQTTHPTRGLLSMQQASFHVPALFALYLLRTPVDGVQTEAERLETLEWLVAWLEDTSVHWDTHTIDGQEIPVGAVPATYSVDAAKGGFGEGTNAALRMAEIWLRMAALTGEETYRQKALCLIGSALLVQDGHDGLLPIADNDNLHWHGTQALGTAIPVEGRHSSHDRNIGEALTHLRACADLLAGTRRSRSGSAN